VVSCSALQSCHMIVAAEAAVLLRSSRSDCLVMAVFTTWPASQHCLSGIDLHFDTIQTNPAVPWHPHDKN
jgi:hypothetical protein